MENIMGGSMMKIVSLQDTFDQCVTHARKQGCRSIDEYDSCLYRDGNGNKCFAGAFIPDSQYDPKFEGGPICEDYISSEVSEILYYLGYDLNFVRELQTIHDWSSVNSWEGQFIKLAERWGLKYTAPAD
jgi:hypothetical protein